MATITNPTENSFDPHHQGGTAVIDENEGGDTVQQYVTFFINDEAFAFPMESVNEIIRSPSTVKVPLTHRTLLGLANLRGTVLPVLDLRRILQMEEKEETDATRVIVTNKGTNVGLLVDSVARVMNVESDKIESADSVQTTVNSEFLNGVIKNTDGFNLIQLLEIKKIVEVNIQSKKTNLFEKESSSITDTLVGQSSNDQEETEDDTIQLVNFIVEGEEYAFEITQVEEIVRIPDDICKIPRSEPHILGMINLRNRLLPLVSLRKMFLLPDLPLEEHNRIVVIRLQTQDGNHDFVGVVVDQVREVLRVPSSTQDNLPPLLARKNDCNEITGVCRLEEGKRLVSLLSANALFHRKDIQRALEARKTMAEDAYIDAEGAGMQESDDEDMQLVVFHLADEEYGVPIETVQEIIRVPNQMNKVPKTAQFIEGMVNLRGTVLPVLDMRKRFDLNKIDRNERQRIIVLNLNGVRTGFIVDALSEVLRISASSIEDSPKLSSEQSLMMGKVANLNNGNRMILILEAGELLNAAEMQTIVEGSDSMERFDSGKDITES